MCADDEGAALVDQSRSELADDPLPVSITEGAAGEDVQSQLDRRLDLVDVLSTGPARARRAHLDLVARNGDAVVDGKVVHAAQPPESRRRACHVKMPVRWPSLNVIPSA